MSVDDIGNLGTGKLAEDRRDVTGIVSEALLNGLFNRRWDSTGDG